MLENEGSVVRDEVGGMNGEHQEENEFYDKAKQYWSNIKPTVDGVLGGFGYISQADIKGSHQFLTSLFESENAPEKGRALDCGAGIGRITKHLLVNFFATVDLVEQNKDFIDKASESMKSIPQVGNFYVAGLQEFQFSEKYDVIWCQWVLSHLTDDHLIEFLKKCQRALTPRGVIVIKENVTSSGAVELDDVDSSVTRPFELLNKILSDSGLESVTSSYQKNFPKGLYPVIMMALRPKTLD